MFPIENIFTEIYLNKHTLKTIDKLSDEKLYGFYLENNLKSQDLLIVLEELLINAQEHGKSDITFLYFKKENLLTMALLDAGSGIHATIPQNARLQDVKGKSTTSILRLSVEEGITGTAILGRGMGLYYLSKLVKEKKATALIASNGGQIIQNEHTFFERTLSTDIQGTCIILQILESET